LGGIAWTNWWCVFSSSCAGRGGVDNGAWVEIMVGNARAAAAKPPNLLTLPSARFSNPTKMFAFARCFLSF
jgi:hypothetical protein